MSWRNKTVLVTGADGFIGSHLVEYLADHGAHVRALCLYTSTGTRGHLEPALAEREGDVGEVTLGDVRDTEQVRRLCSGVDVVFHLAALIAIPHSYQSPRAYLETNVTGALNVLEAVRMADCQRMVHVSSSEVYGTPEVMPIRETHPLQAQSPYAASKIAADQFCLAYHASFGTPVTVIRPFNTYGPRQSLRAVIPTILAQLLDRRQKLKLGSLAPRRDLTYVTDTVAALARAGLADGVEGQVIQLGTGESVSVEEVAKLAMDVVGHDAAIEIEQERIRPAGSEVAALLSDPSKAHELLGWKPSVPLRMGLERTSRWLHERLDGFEPTRYYL